MVMPRWGLAHTLLVLTGEYPNFRCGPGRFKEPGVGGRVPRSRSDF